MPLFAKLKGVALWLIYVRRFGSRWASPLARNLVWPLEGHRGPGGSLVAPGLGVELTQPNVASLILLRAHRYAKSLHERAGATFQFESEQVLASVDGISFVAKNEADLGVLFEVFVEQLYRFQIASPLFVFDVGANIGASALYFAHHYEADVLAYELVPSTADIARENLKRNPDLALRITLESCGISDQNGELSIDVNPSFRPSNSLFIKVPDNASKESVVTLDIAEVWEAHRSKAAGRSIVLKLDVEGAEYEIVERMRQTGLLKEVTLAIIEWHERPGNDPAAIRAALLEAGFIWTERGHPEAPAGFIVAYRGSTLPPIS